MTKTLSCQWAAASLDRFAAEDIANLVPDASRSTIDDVVSDLRQQDLIERAAIRPLGRGRPRVEYAWRAGAREHRRERLEAEMTGLDRVRAEADRYAEFAPAEGTHRLAASLEQIKALVDAALTTDDARQRKALAARAEAEYGVLKTMQAEDPRLAEFRLFDAGRQLERLLASTYDPWQRPAAASGVTTRRIWEPLVARARAPAVAVLDHFAAPLLNPRRFGAHVRAGLAHMSAPGDDFTLILDTSSGAPDPWLDAYAAEQGHDCAVLHLSGASEGELDVQMRQLLEFFVTPVSANTHVCMFVDGSEHSNASVKEIADIFGDPGTVRAAMDAARDTLVQATAEVDGQVLGAVATSTLDDEPDWFAQGLKRHFAIGVMTGKKNLPQETLLKATLNDPVVICDRPFVARGAIAAFGEVRVASMQDMKASVARSVSTLID